jgi:hypothetical protein
MEKVGSSYEELPGGGEMSLYFYFSMTIPQNA